jgi:transposase
MSDSFRFFLGIDLGSQNHQVHLLNAAGEPLGQLHIEHGGAGIQALLDWLARSTTPAAPESVAVAVETPRGAVIDALLERRYAVFSINPKQLDRFRDRFSVAGAKDDRRDALVLAHSLRTDGPLFRRLRPDDPRLLELRELSRAEDALAADLRRSSNQLWSYLQRYFPALLGLCPAADEPWLWDLLRRIAALPQRAARLSTRPLETLLARHRIRRFSGQQLRQALGQPLPLAPGVEQALAAPVLLLLPRLQLLHQQRAELVRRIQATIDALAQDESFAEHRSIKILRSIPGVGRVCVATVLAEAITPLTDRDYHCLRALAGMAPVTQQSGKTCIVSMRRAYNRPLQHALFHAAGVHLQYDARARLTYARLRQHGHTHARAIRGVADRLLELICRLLRTGELYDPSRRVAQPSAA